MTGQAVLGETVLKQAKAIPVEPSQATETVDGIETLVAQHAVLVFRIAYSILRNHHDAEDAAQECFLKMVKAKKRLPEVRNPKTWLARIAWTTALDRRDARPVFSGAPHLLGDDVLAEVPDRAPAADELLARKQSRQMLARLVAGLPEDLREVIELSTVQELNSAEIAEVIDIPESSVRTRLLRARRLLKEKLSVVLEAAKHD
jgi:RNA polymerase sigma-70 factor (ECF subfamily)